MGNRETRCSAVKTSGGFDMGLDVLLQILPLHATWRDHALAAIGLVTLIIWFWILHKRKINGGSRGRLPPGPYPWPIIGNLHQLRQPAHRALKELSQKYGPIMFLRLGSVPTVVVSSSAMAEHFLKTHDSIFASRPATAVGMYLAYNFKGVLMTPYGDYWRQIRKLCVLELLTAKRIESFKNVREEEVCAMIRSIWEESQRGTVAVNVSNAMFTVASNIIWRIMARKNFSDDDLGANGARGFKDLLLEVTATVGAFNVGDFIPYLDWLDLQGIKRRMMKVAKTFDTLAEKIINDHVDQGEAAEHGKDFVDVLLQMTADQTQNQRENIKAIMLDMFGAGVESTATVLEWAMSELLRHPEVMKRLQEEIEFTLGKHGKVNESDLEGMKYLLCVVKETLRLYPPAPLALPHESVEAVNVGGYCMPKKTTLMVNVWAIGRDPDVWGADAWQFKPERFMEEFGGRGSTDIMSGRDFRMLPFGAGRRGCPGVTMAMPTIQLALAQLLHIFDWTVEGDPSQLDMSEACSATMPRQVPLFAFPRLRVSACI